MSKRVADMTDLQERLREAEKKLIDLGNSRESSTEGVRLRGKAEGVRLALTYIEEALRGDRD